MATLQISVSESLYERLNRYAEAEETTIDAIAQRLLADYVEKMDQLNEPNGPAIFAALTRNSVRSNFTDTAERSRDILNGRYTGPEPKAETQLGEHESLV